MVRVYLFFWHVLCLGRVLHVTGWMVAPPYYASSEARSRAARTRSSRVVSIRQQWMVQEPQHAKQKRHLRYREEHPVKHNTTAMASALIRSFVQVSQRRSAEKRLEVSKSASSLGDISKELGRMCKETTNRQKFDDLAAADEKSYEAEKINLSRDENNQVKPKETVANIKKTAPKNQNGVLTPKTAAQSKKKTPRAPTELGEMDGSKVTVKDGRFGVYVNWKKINVNMPAEYLQESTTIPLETAWDLILAKGGGGKSGATAKKNGPVLPPAPKRPKSAYLYFCAAKRPEASKVASSLGDISKELARLWAETADREAGRKEYEDLAVADKIEYEKRKQSWKLECDEILAKAPKKTRASNKKGTSNVAKEANLPKRPLSAYSHFCAEKRREVSKSASSLGDVSKELGRMWKETTDRQKFDDLAAASKERYEAEKIKLSRDEKNQVKPKQTVANIKKTPPPKKNGALTPKTAAPTKTKSSRAPSAYMLFCAEHRQEANRDESGNKRSFGETTRKLAKLWLNCDPQLRATFEQTAAEVKEKLAMEQVPF